MKEPQGFWLSYIDALTVFVAVFLLLVVFSLTESNRLDKEYQEIKERAINAINKLSRIKYTRKKNKYNYIRTGKIINVYDYYLTFALSQSLKKILLHFSEVDSIEILN